MAKTTGGSGRNGRGGGSGGFRRGDFVTDGLVRGIVVGRGTVGNRNTPVTRINIGGGRTTIVVTDQLSRIA